MGALRRDRLKHLLRISSHPESGGNRCQVSTLPSGVHGQGIKVIPFRGARPYSVVLVFYFLHLLPYQGLFSLINAFFSCTP